MLRKWAWKWVLIYSVDGFLHIMARDMVIHYTHTTLSIFLLLQQNETQVYVNMHSMRFPRTCVDWLARFRYGPKAK